MPLSLHSLAAFRILVGTGIFIKFVFILFPAFGDVFSPETGILGNCFRTDYVRAYPSYGPGFDILTDSGMYGLMLGICVLAAGFALGFYPKVTGTLLCLLLAWFNERYSVLYFGWETYLSCLLFLTLFLPVNSRFSFFPSPEPAGGAPRNIFAFLLLFQIGFLYFYNGVSKNGGTWFSGDAVALTVYEADKMTRFSSFLIENGALSRLLTYATLVWEIGLIFLLFIPYKPVLFRSLAAVSIVLFHWGIALFTDVGLFKYVSLAAAVVLLPEAFWQTGVFKRLTKVKFRRFSLPHFAVKIPRALQISFGIFLLSQLLFSNLAQSSRSKTDDRFGNFLQKSGLGKTVEKAWLIRNPYYSFFGQYWHLYSPDPPAETGYSVMEGTTVDGKIIRIENGEPVDTDAKLPTVKKWLYAYLTLRGNNQKDLILMACMVSRDLNFYLRNPQHPPLRSVELVTYSRRLTARGDLKSLPAGYTRVIRQQFTRE